MVDIQSATAEIRRGKKERKIEEETKWGKNIMSASAIRRAAMTINKYSLFHLAVSVGSHF